MATIPSSPPPAGEEGGGGGGGGGEGEMKMEEKGGGRPPEEVVPQSVPESAPLKEEPKGPRPIASVSVPGMPLSAVQVCTCRGSTLDKCDVVCEGVNDVWCE